MTLPLTMPLLRVLSVALVALGILLTVVTAQRSDSVLGGGYRLYTGHLNRQLKLLFLPGSGERIFLMQAIVLAAIIGAAVVVGGSSALRQEGISRGEVNFYGAMAAVIALVAPAINLALQRHKHVRRLESQTDTLILGLANALKTVPSPAAALAAVCPVLPDPMQLEIDRLLKEMRVGSTLEQALLNMSSRIGSQELDTALSALLIGLQVGGNLPSVLENTAATIREMNRLQGVVKTKTSDARMQLWVLALFPFGICYVFSMLQPGFFDPLQESFVGNLITVVALVLWVASLVSANKILKVDI